MRFFFLISKKAAHERTKQKAAADLEEQKAALENENNLKINEVIDEYTRINLGTFL